MSHSETVLFYSPDPILALRAGKVFASLGVAVKTVAAAQMGQTLGALLELKGHAVNPSAPSLPAPARPVLVMSGFSRPRMDALLAALREGDVPPIGLKAVVTPTNLTWTFGALCAELAREHAQLHGGPLR